MAIKRWPLTPGYILRPDGIPISEAATEQAYEIFNGIADEAEYLARHHDPKQVLVFNHESYIVILKSFFGLCSRVDFQLFTMDVRRGPWKA